MIKVLLVALTSALVAGTLIAEEAPTAAEIDWTPAAGLSADAAAALPWYCDGRYVAPAPGTTPGEGRTAATAESSERVADNFTILEGNVVIDQEFRQIRSPRVALDERTDIATIEGPLVIREDGLVMTGTHAVTDLFSGQGVVDSATFLLHQTSLRGSADRITRSENTDLHLDRSSFTRCDPGSNVWSVRGKRMRLEQRTGFGTARNVTLALKGVPVAWFPYIRFPIDNKRHSGFLMPSAGYDSDGGTDFLAPYYLNLAPDYDATYQPRSLWKRGLIHDAQLRFLAGPTSNEMNLGFIRQDDIYDDRDLLDLTSSQVDTSSVPVPPFEKQDRWYINLRHSGDWTSRLKTSGTYSAVSDIDYLHDIGGDVGSTTIDQFVGPIDQNLANRISAALDRRGQVEWRGNGWNAAMLIQGFQSLDPLGQEQYEMIPQLSADFGHGLGPLKIGTRVEYALFDKDNDALSGPLAILGERAVAEMDISMRKSAIWGFIQPAIGVIHRKYNLNDIPAGVRSNPEVTTGHFSLDGGLFFDRFFTARRGRDMLQTLEPRVFYLYREEDFQDDLPQFDAGALTPGYAQLFRDNRFNGKDRVGDARHLGFGVTTRFLDQTTGAQLLEASVGQIYYFKDRSVIFQPTPADDPLARESPLYAQARLTLANGLNISGTLEWEPDVSRTNRSTITLKYKAGDRKILNLNYIYNSPVVQPVASFLSAEETDLNFIWPLYRNWSVIGRWNFSWDRHQTVESFYGFEYNDCCWKTRLVIRRFLKEPRDITILVDDPASPTGFTTEMQTITPPDMAIFVEFQMKGLATLGRRINLLLEQAIPGYEDREAIVGQ